MRSSVAACTSPVQFNASSPALSPLSPRLHHCISGRTSCVTRGSEAAFAALLYLTLQATLLPFLALP